MSADTGQTWRISSARTGVLFHGISQPEHSHAEQIVFTLDDPVDISAFTDAWQALAARHAILRSGFHSSMEQGTAQFAMPRCEIPVEQFDWRNEDSGIREARLAELCTSWQRDPFDAARPPLFRIALIRWNAREWRVVWTLRRALLDWRSMSTLLRELFADYRLRKESRESASRNGADPADDGAQPAALVSGYPGWLDRTVTATDTDFWKSFLADLAGPTTLDLPRPSASADDNAYGVLERRLDAAGSDRVRQLRKAADVTLNNLAQSAWALLLSHYARTDDVLFGVLRSCRRSGPPGLEDAVGSFLNILPLRAKIPNGNVFELLWHVRDQHRKVREHECSHLADIEGCTDIDGALFDSVLEFDQRDPMAALEELLQELGPRDFRHYAGPLAGLHLQVYGEDRIVLRLKYSPALLDAATASRLLDHYGRILTGMAAEPWVNAGDVHYLDASESGAVRWVDAPRIGIASDRASTIAGRFEEQAAAHPDAIALACGDALMTYAELNAAANRLAHRLRAEGAAPDRLIGLCAERSPELIVGMLGILKSGAAYLPLDPAYPAERLEFLLHDAQAGIVVAPEAMRDALPGNPVCIDPRVSADDAPDANPQATGSGENLAYVIYTSGSTGQPKGVMVTQHNVVRLFDTCQGWLNAGADDVWTMFHSFAFDFSVWEIWGALLHGGRLEIVPRDIARSPESFRELLIERGVTILNQTPSAFRQLMNVDAADHRAMPALRVVIFGGEKLDPASLAGWMERHGDEQPQLINMYGITETTVHVTYRRLLRKDVDASGSLIGWPLPDLYVRLLDAEGRPVPPGVRGEICVGGAGVTRGYLNRAELTAARFVRDPLEDDANARLYRSGDFARLTSDGELCYLGREDDQVKIRGFRIDLGEIANTLKRIAGIEQAIVVPRETADGGERRLFAYYVTSGDSVLPEKRVREQLAARLPEHMLPAMLIRLPAIPVNANNKIDFKALPDPSQVHAGEVSEGDAPATQTEVLLARLWREVLERADIGRDDDFFGLGGDSILALKLVARARAEGLDLVPRDIFHQPVLADLARNARPLSGHAHEEEADVNKDGPWALTPIQRWFFDQALENRDHWNEGFFFRVPPDTDVDRLERALLTVVRHHDALHVRFTREERGARAGQWVARPVKPEEALEFSRIELDHLDDDERREAIDLITAEIQESLSLSSGLLVRAAHFTGGLEDGTRLLIVIHQLAADAASWAIILQDIDTAYRALAAGEEPVLPEPSISYAGWAAQLERVAGTALVASEHAYWEQILRTGSEGPLADAVVQPGREADARTVKVTLDTQDTAALLGDIHHAYGTNIHELLIAGLSRAIAGQWPQLKQLRLDLMRHGRNDDIGALDLSRTVGWFNVLHPVVLDLTVARQTGRLICDVKARLRGAPHEGAGYGMLRYLRPSGATVFGRAVSQRAPVVFSYLGQFERALASSLLQHCGEYAGMPRGGDNPLTHPLAVTAKLHDDRMEFAFRFSPEVLPAEDVEAIAQRFTGSLQMLIRHCRTRDAIVRTPVDFPLAQLTQEELDRFPVPLENVEEILPLSPIQRLHHALSGTDKDVGFDQWVFQLRGRIDETAFEAAWQELFRRHDALRTIFVDRGLHEPRQVVLRAVDFRVQRTDWRLLDETVQQQRLHEFLADDRRQGLEMHVAPLTRVTLIRRADDRWTLVWSHHQALVDGWSWPILASELGELHDAQLSGSKPSLEPPGSYRSYISWLMDRDLGEYAKFWREYLHGAPGTLITRSRRRNDSHSGQRALRRVERELPGESGASIARLARERRLTPSVVFQAAWALLLSGLTLRFDVTLGVAFSGRTAGIADASNTVGPFLNDLPVRVRVEPTARVSDWLASLRGVQADVNHYQNVSPLEVHEWSGHPPGTRLFDALLVFQNYATGDAMRRWSERILVEGFSAGVRTNYPLTLAVTPGRNYRLEFFHDEKVIDGNTVDALANDLVSILQTIARTPEVRIATIINHVAGDGRKKESSIARSPDGRWRRRVSDQLAEEIVVAPEQLPSDADASAMETLVTGICRDVTGIDDFGRDRNFFDVGAQSMALIEIHARLQAKLERSFPIVMLFQHPTVARLARYLEAERDSAESEARLNAARRRGADHRAALAQRRRPIRQPGPTGEV